MPATQASFHENNELSLWVYQVSKMLSSTTCNTLRRPLMSCLSQTTAVIHSAWCVGTGPQERLSPGGMELFWFSWRLVCINCHKTERLGCTTITNWRILETKEGFIKLYIAASVSKGTSKRFLGKSPEKKDKLLMAEVRGYYRDVHCVRCEFLIWTISTNEIANCID